ncbi:hypothetical protein ACWA7J_12370 [Leptothrix sp. BB-4]
MSPALPNPPAPTRLRRPDRQAPLLCLLAVLALHGLLLRDAPGWLARPAAAATPTAAAGVHSMTTRMLMAEVAPEPAPVAAVAAPAPVPRPVRRTLAVNDAPATAPAPAPAASAAAVVPAPAPIRLDYKLQRGAIAGEARLDWRHDGRRYTLDLDGQLPLIGTLMHQHSEGGFDAAGLAPLRYTERRLRRSERAVSFNRPADGQPGRITFSASTADLPLRAGAQDRVSWMVQLAARLAGVQTLPANGSRIEMDVAGAGGDVQDWHFVLQGRAADGSWHWRRDTGEPDATQADVWTDPANGHWPRRVRLADRQGEPIELVLKGH